MKGSEIKSAAEQAELKKALLEFTQKLETDPYQPGLVHPDLMPDDLIDILEDLLWIRGFETVTLKIQKTGDSIKVEVSERNK
jgi:hypothetical protein